MIACRSVPEQTGNRREGPMTTTDPFTFTTERADRFHTSYATGGLQRQLYAEAFGEEYPAEVDPTSSCTWPVLAVMVRGLRLRPDDLLVDLGCGRGGTGLWLARACSARLIGIDISPRGVAMAVDRAAHFVPEQQATFRVGTFEDTGLPDACADGVVSMDALPFSSDRDAALRELRRILRPGARAVFTGNRLAPSHPKYGVVSTWPERIARAGLTLEHEEAQAGAEERWLRLYDLWERHESELRAEIGDQAIADLLTEARTLKTVIPHLTSTIYTVRA